MLNLRPALVLVVVALLVSSAAGTFTWYSDKYTHPEDKTQFIRAYVTTANNNATSTLLAVGLQMTAGFVEKAPQLPIQITSDIPMGPNKTFTFQSTPIVLTIPKAGKGNPFKFWNIGFQHNGHPYGFPSSLGIWDVPHWDFHAYMINETQHANVWKVPQTFGDCVGGMSPAAFRQSASPMAEGCEPRGYTNLGDTVWGDGGHLVNTNTDHFEPPKYFDHDLIYGTYSGKLIFVEPMVANDFLLAATAKGSCIDLKDHIPKAGQAPYNTPASYCIRKLGGTSGIAVEFKDFRKVPKGSCVVGTDGVKGAAATYFPTQMAFLLPQACQDAIPRP